jgi:Uma2 family endonuclease
MSTETLSRTPIAELWSRIVEDPRFDDLPYKVETNERGQLILSPHKPQHSFRQTGIVMLIASLARDSQLPAGKPAVEFAIATPRGVKVPDVVWISDERAADIPTNAEASPTMPELVIEVLSPGNTRREMAEKRDLYFAAGAREVWTCDPEGRMAFYDDGGEIPTSALVPSFPASIP